MSESAIVTIGIGAPVAVLGLCVLPIIAAGLVCRATARLLTNLAGELRELPNSGALDAALRTLNPAVVALQAVKPASGGGGVRAACATFDRALGDLDPTVLRTLSIAAPALVNEGRAAIAEASALAAAGDPAEARRAAARAAKSVQAAHREAVGALSRAEREVTAAAYRAVLVDQGFANLEFADAGGVSAITATRGTQEVAVAVRDGGRSLLDIAGCEAATGNLAACRPLQQELLQGLRDRGLTVRTETVRWNATDRGGVLLRPAYADRRPGRASLAARVARVASEAAGKPPQPPPVAARENRRRDAAPVRESDR